MTKRRLLPLLLLAMLLAALAAAPSALALPPPTTQITSPADNFYTLYNYETNAGTISVSGSTTGVIAAVDIRCYNDSANNFRAVAPNVPVDGSGNFSVTNVSMSNLNGYSCLLVAVPHLTTPTIPDPLYAGVRLTANTTGNNFVAGKPYDYYDYIGEGPGGFGYDSISGCGLAYSQLNDAYNRATTYPLGCNQYITYYTPANATPPISGLQVNGLNAFAAQPMGDGTAGGTAGFPQLVHTSSIDPVTHDGTVNETAGFATCPNNITAPDNTNCASATDVGVVLTRTMHQNHAGLMTRINDSYKNTTGAPVTINLAYKQAFYLALNSGATKITTTFPNGASVTDATPFEAVGPFTSPGTIYGSDPTKADGDVTSGRVALTMFPSADSVMFSDAKHFFLRYSNKTIPAGGTYEVDAIFSQSYTQAQLAGLAAEAENAITPQPTFGKSKKATLKLDKKQKHIAFSSGRSVICPPTGAACAISGKLIAKIKLPKKHGSKKVKYKSITLGTYKKTRPPGSTTSLKLTIGSAGIKLFKKYGKLNTEFTVKATAGPHATLLKTFKATLKSPKFRKH